MAKRKIASTVSDPVDLFRQRITLKNSSEALKRRADQLGTRLKDYVKSNFDFENDGGSRFVEFGQTVEVDGKSYKGIEARRSVSVSLDLDKAEVLLRKKKLYEDALTPVLDPDKIMLLAQKGELKATDIDKMMVERETWSLWPSTGEVLD